MQTVVDKAVKTWHLNQERRVNQVKSSTSHHDGNLSYGMDSSQNIDVEQASPVTDRRLIDYLIE